MSNALTNTRQPSWNHAFVTFNNQNSVLMCMSVPIYNLLCLFHDNRIFAFERKQESDDASSDEQNVLLNLLTTPKYRALSAMYIIFRLLDNTGLLLIIVLSIMDLDFTIPTKAQTALLAAIGIEIFYDVMLYTHKYWILQRLSIYIGIMLYGAYVVIVAWKNLNGEYTPRELHIVIRVLAARFIAFIFEECVDIAIDVELHNDLFKLQTHRGQEIRVDPEQNAEQNAEPNESQPLIGEPISHNHRPTIHFSCLLSPSKFKIYMDVRNTVKMPPNVNYIGSFFAWGPKSVFTEEVWTKVKIPRWPLYFLCFGPFIVTVILLLLLILLCLVASIIPILLAFLLAAICHCTCNPCILMEKVTASNFWKELTHF